MYRLQAAGVILAMSVSCRSTIPSARAAPSTPAAEPTPAARAASAEPKTARPPAPVPAAADPVQEQFPTHTTVQEPYLGRNLELAAPLPRYFSSTPSLRREHDLANRLVRAVASGLQSKRWHLEIRTGCPVEGDGNVFVEGRALVRDSSGRLRAYAEASGTGDSAGVWKSYYDEAARLRAVFVRWANYMGHSAEAILRFDESGRIEGCSSPPDLQPPWACGRAEHGVDGVLIQWLRSIEPGRELGRCLVPYRPTE